MLASKPFLIVFSHLRWDFVYQRPQQLMSRLAAHYQVLYVEEPVTSEGDARWEVMHPADDVDVYRPHSPRQEGGFAESQVPVMRELLDALLRERGILDPVAWLYTPMALPLVERLRPRVIVYDCMDELSAFHHAPPALVQLERELLSRADLVFTGGPSLYAAKQPFHGNVHCFSSSVDSAHFAQALTMGDEHALQSALAHPRLGFFGVIDERMDIDLLDQLARARPKWQIVMVGPIVKIDPAILPRHANVHYYGMRSYDELPGFLAGWDVCLLPFALNDSTRYISPTKTLEYMAAEKPIVSTPITDVVTPYGHLVRIGIGEEFIEQCSRALEETPRQRQQRETMMRRAVQATSWDKTANEMRALIDTALSAPAEPKIVASAAASLTASEPAVVIIGAGPTGLSAAYHLSHECLLLEQHATVGGWCRSVVENGFTFDYAGHIMFSNDADVHAIYRELLGDNVHWQDREAWVFSKGVYTRYPFQGSLFGLPGEVISECLIGAVEAQRAPRNEPPANFSEFIDQVWGRGIAKHFAVPYNRKLWTVPLESMETSWLGGRVPIPDLAEMIDGALRPVDKPMGPNARFGYPLRGGFQALMDGFVKPIGASLRLNARVAQINPSRRRVVLADGTVHRYQQLISTMPLPTLVKLMGAEAPQSVREAAAGLKHVSIRCVNLGIDRSHVTDKHWIYYPESTIFHRIFAQGNASPFCSPVGGFGLTCEISYSDEKPLPCEGEALIDRCIEDCISVGMLKPHDRVLVRNQLDMPYAYVIYDHHRRRNVATIRDWMTTQNIILSGRYSEWEYYNSDHAFIAGRRAAREAGAALEMQVSDASVESLSSAFS